MSRCASLRVARSSHTNRTTCRRSSYMPKPILKSLLAVTLPLLLTASCAFAEEVSAPAITPPRNFAWMSTDERLDKADQVQFWRRFDDAKLTELVERALRENHDLRI